VLKKLFLVLRKSYLRRHKRSVFLEYIILDIPFIRNRLDYVRQDEFWFRLKISVYKYI